MTRRRFILPLIWLTVLVLTAAWILWAPLPPAPKAGPHDVVFIIHRPLASRGNAELLGPFAVFAVAYAIIDAWLELAYHRWLAWAQLALVLAGATGLYGVPAILLRVDGGATVSGVIGAYKASAPFETAGYFLAWAGFGCFAAVLLDIVIQAWRRPHPN